jgi:hypothetical protein
MLHVEVVFRGRAMRRAYPMVRDRLLRTGVVFYLIGS